MWTEAKLDVLVVTIIISIISILIIQVKVSVERTGGSVRSVF